MSEIAIVNQIVPASDPFESIIFTQFARGNVWLEKFVFSAVWNTLAASASGQTANMTIDPDIDFLAQEMNLTSFSAAGTIVANPDYLMEVQEKSGNNNWSDGPVHVSNWTGQNRNSGSQPEKFHRYIRGNNTVAFKLTNLTATAARVDLALVGYRVTYVNISRSDLFNIPF